jgi:hypothetical protein
MNPESSLKIQPLDEFGAYNDQGESGRGAGPRHAYHSAPGAGGTPQTARPSRALLCEAFFPATSSRSIWPTRSGWIKSRRSSTVTGATRTRGSGHGRPNRHGDGRVRYAVATGGTASCRLKAPRRRSPVPIVTLHRTPV